MFRHTIKFLQHLLQDFASVSDHFEMLCLNRLIEMANFNLLSTNTTEWSNTQATRRLCYAICVHQPLFALCH